MKYLKMLWIAVSGIILLIMASVVIIETADHKERSDVRTNCEATEFYTIDSRGHKSQVYDCSK